MTEREVQVKGLDELVQKTQWDVLAQPEFDAALESFGKRMERQGKGLGAQRNSIRRETQSLGARAESTLNYPRTRGSAWQRKQEGALKSMAPRVLNKMVKRIEERWAAQNPASVGPGSYGDVE